MVTLFSLAKDNRIRLEKKRKQKKRPPLERRQLGPEKRIGGSGPGTNANGVGVSEELERLCAHMKKRKKAKNTIWAMPASGRKFVENYGRETALTKRYRPEKVFGEAKDKGNGGKRDLSPSAQEKINRSAD